ncbi:hypothetical protein IA539_11720 [Gordonia sp. zg691]|uniref:hypothetical protein n=1 Tax=Gordonia jinghuaiqii TaxID=2758710 RepID=UPI0016621D89|nr:hypothetical protein [Gordonia jinghuaiqii]MBD0861877.1 hypothetical protein [Gordonia jinghuaiqii]
MNTLPDLITAPFGWLSALRHARVFHPDGLLCGGSAAVSGDHPLPFRSGPVSVRVSKGIGTPGGLPDIVGLAIRFPASSSPATDTATAARSPGTTAAGAWDLLLAGPAPLSGRLPVPLPTTHWATEVSSLTPYRHDGELYWIRARIFEPADASGLSIEDLAAFVRQNKPIVIILEAGSRRFVPIARIELDHLLTGLDVDFDPILHKPDGVEFAPSWLGDLRRRAYRDSRAGRHSVAS